MNYDQILCKRMIEVPLSGIRKFFDIVSEMKDVISLGVGEPDFNTPWAYTDAAIYSLRQGHTHYTSNWGVIELRRAIVEYMESRFNASYNPLSEVLVTVGASEGIDLALRAVLEQGDEVVVPNPSYVSYMPCVRFAGGECVPVPTDAEREFKLMPDALKAAITPRTKALILPYPNNPTGAVMTRADLEAIADVLRGTNIVVISDEIYAELTYEGKHVCFADIPGMWERTVVLNGFSKAFAMTGWRMGYACGPKELIGIMCKIHQYTVMCAPTSAQYAALEGLNTNMQNGFSDVRRMVDTYDRRRRLIVGGLREVGLKCHEPTGAFYAFPAVPDNMNSQDFCERLLYEKKVAAVPGDAFGTLGDGFFRCSYAASNENIKKAVERIGEFVQAI